MCILYTPWKVLADDQTPDSNVVDTITFAIILDNVYDSLGFVVLNPQGKTPGRLFWVMKFVVILLGAIKHQLYEKNPVHLPIHSRLIKYRLAEKSIIDD